MKSAKALNSFAERKMKLREDVILGDGGGILPAGTVVKKAELDRLIAAGIKDISVVGSGAVVSVNATVIPVILIFICMTLVLQGIFWEPMIELMHGRKRELEDGSDCLKHNAIEAVALEEDRAEKLREVQRNCLKIVADARHEAMVESEVIIKDMRRKMHTMRQDAEEELIKTMAVAEKQVEEELPGLAKSIVSTVTVKS